MCVCVCVCRERERERERETRTHTHTYTYYLTLDPFHRNDPKETYYSVTRDLLQCQKRPNLSTEMTIHLSCCRV